MSSAAMRNDANVEAGGSRRRGRPRGQRSIRFTVVFDNISDLIVLEADQPFSELKRLVAERFTLSVDDLFIYGWPGQEPTSDNVLIKNLSLPEEDQLLYVAVSGNPQPQQQEQLLADERFTGSQILVPNDEVAISVVTIMENVENEPLELSFNKYNTVMDVKKKFVEMTDISMEDQEWSGWPDAIVDNCILKDANLDVPIHSLILIKRMPTVTDVRNTENKVMAVNPNDKATPSSPSISSATEITDTPSTGMTATARKRTSKSALKEAKRSRLASTDDKADIRTNKAKNEGLIDDGQLPCTSRQAYGATVPSCSFDSSRAFRSSSPEERTPTNNLDLDTTEKCVKDDDEVTQPTPVQDTVSLDTDILIAVEKEEIVKKISQRHGSKSHFIAFLSRIDEKESTSNSTTLRKASEFLLEYLDPVSQLSLRRVCKTTREWITRSNTQISRKEEEKWKWFSLTVTGIGVKCFDSVVNMNLPITKYVFDNSFIGESFYETESVDSFIAYAGLKVKDLRIKNFYMFQNRRERNLFESFHRLEKLAIDNLVIPDNSDTSHPLPCPPVLGSLQVLKLNYEVRSPVNNALIRPRCWDFTWGMLSDCKSLLYLRLPSIVENEETPLASTDGIFTPLTEYISSRERNGDVPLEYLDLRGFNNSESRYINRYVQLLRNCHSKDIKMKNVQSMIIQKVLNEDGDIKDEKYKFCENIISIINFTPFMENAPFRNLEKITVDVIPSVTDYVTMAKEFKDLFWPKLSTIKILDSFQKKTSNSWKGWQSVQENLYGLNIFDRGSVRSITINSPKVPYFLSEGVLPERFYNLRRLEITSWFENDKEEVLNKRLTAIWKKARLEELIIKGCPMLNDGSFTANEEEEVDDDEEISNSNYRHRAVFLRQSMSLKKMTLELVNTRVSDDSFRVFSKMMFKTLVIISFKPINVCEATILKMKKRTFGKYIEHFPFNCWSSAKIDRARFERLGKEFRSRR